MTTINTLNDLQDYLEELCKAHALISHGPNRRAFARINTEEHITQIQQRGGANICVVAAINGQRTGEIDSRALRRGVTLLFSSKASRRGERGDAVTAAMETAESIMFDFANQIEQDSDLFCGWQLDLTGMSWDEIEGMWLDNYFGWMLFIPFKGYMPPYNPLVWNLNR